MMIKWPRSIILKVVRCCTWCWLFVVGSDGCILVLYCSRMGTAAAAATPICVENQKISSDLSNVTVFVIS